MNYRNVLAHWGMDGEEGGERNDPLAISKVIVKQHLR